MASNVSLVGLASENSVFQFKISLKYPKPPIWRRVLVPGDYTFRDLHFVIQSVMSWSNSHMHKFNLKEHLTDEEIEVGGSGDLGFTKWMPESTKLHSFFKNGNCKATYDYDFGSTWYHNILLERILPADRTQKYPQCTAGRRASPPEHCSPDELEEEFDPELFDAKLITFRKCRDFLEVDDEVPSNDLSLDENANDSPKYPSFNSSLGSASSEVESDSEQTALSPETSITELDEQTVDNQQIFMDCLLSQNSNKKASSILPRKRKVPEDKETKSVPAKLIFLGKKDLQINSNTISKTTRITKNSESGPSNSKGLAKDINVSHAIGDAEDYYGKFIASQMRAIKDLKRRENLRIEIQQLISKYRFKN